MYVCLYVNSETAGPFWLNFFLLAPSWSRGDFRPKNSGSGFSGNLEKKPGFQGIIWPIWLKFSGNNHLEPNILNTNKFLDWVSGFPDPETSFLDPETGFPEKSGKIWQKSGLTVYHDVIYHFLYSNHGELILAFKCAIWRIFQICWKVRIIK